VIEYLKGIDLSLFIIIFGICKLSLSKKSILIHRNPGSRQNVPWSESHAFLQGGQNVPSNHDRADPKPHQNMTYGQKAPSEYDWMDKKYHTLN